MAQQLCLRTKHHKTMWIIFRRDEQFHCDYRPPGTATCFVILKYELSREALKTRCTHNSRGYDACLICKIPCSNLGGGARFLGNSLFVVFTRKYFSATINLPLQFPNLFSFIIDSDFTIWRYVNCAVEKALLHYAKNESANAHLEVITTWMYYCNSCYYL